VIVDTGWIKRGLLEVAAFFVILIIATLVAASIATEQRESESCGQITGARRITCYESGCSLLYEFPDQTRKWIWISTERTREVESVR